MKLEKILEACLTAVEEGRSTPEECLARYPQLRGELEPLLKAARRLRSTHHPVLSEPKRLAMRERIISLPRQQRQSVAMPRLILRPAMILATLLFAFLLGGSGLALASEGSVPGDNLYPVKRTFESIALAFVPNGEPEANLRLFIAQRRLNEAVALAEKGKIESAENLLGEYQQQLEAVEWLIAYEIGSSGKAPRISSSLQDHLAQQEAQLAEIRSHIPAEHTPFIDGALTTIQQFQGVTEQVLQGTPPPFPIPAIPFFRNHPFSPAGGHTPPRPESPESTPTHLPTIPLPN